MNIKKEGYIVEYEADFYGGPADGLHDSVIVINKEDPPKYTFFEINGNEIKPTEVEFKFLNAFVSKKPRKDDSVAVYRLVGSLDDGEDSLIYNFVETTKYSTYCKNY